MTTRPIFPAYVPEKVRLRAEQLLHGAGAGTGDGGWTGVLDGLQSRRNQIEQCLHDPDRLSEEALSALHQERRSLSARIEQTKNDLDCLERLTRRPDRDLSDVYALLIKHLKDDEQVWSFIYAAVSANIEFTGYRDALKSARERKRAIAKQAQVLAELLDSFDETGIHGPDVFWSVRSLLEHTDAPENNIVVWRQMRSRVLGEYDSVDADGVTHNASAVADDLEDDDYQDLPDDDFVVGEIEEGAAVTASPEHDLRYAWHVAPPLSDLLKTLSKAADAFEPREHDLIGAALGTRQESVKAHYIRAFAHLLKENEVSITPPIMRAMAKTATLVIDREDLVVSYDNVRKAL